MERMKHTGDYELDEINMLEQECADLEEENKRLEEENKKLKMSERRYKNQYDFDEECLRKLEEENKKLKKYYDRDKEELMESCYGLARENDKLKSDLMEDMKEITKLEKENKKLKSDLSECECSLGFENDEVGYRKREYKRLKKWIKDHCKGYGNLFPEDEMKRQWKKADKKRK